MATHGCLLIIDRVNKRQRLLHTYHTGMHIPLAVRGAIEVLAKNKWYMAKFHDTVEDMIEQFSCNLVAERLHWVDSVAALIIAAEPCLLEPITPAAVRNLPSWGGQDTPYKLIIRDDNWELFDEDGTSLEKFDPDIRLAEAILRLRETFTGGEGI